MGGKVGCVVLWFWIKEGRSRKDCCPFFLLEARSLVVGTLFLLEMIFISSVCLGKHLEHYYIVSLSFPSSMLRIDELGVHTIGRSLV